MEHLNLFALLLYVTISGSGTRSMPLRSPFETLMMTKKYKCVKTEES